MRENNGGLVKGLVSVVIPTYNRKELVMRAIRSVIAQTYHDIEIIVVDDGSTDGTEAVIKTFEQESGEERIHYYYQSNQGVSAARNYGMTRARGEYLQFLDSDDYIHPQKIQKQVNSLLNSHAEASVCDVEKKAPESKEVTRHWSNQDIRKRLIKLDYIGVGAVLFRRASIPPNLLFREDCNYGEDGEFLFLSFLYFRTFAACPEELLIYDIHGASQLTNRPETTIDEYRAIFRTISKYIKREKKYVLTDNNWMISQLCHRLSEKFYRNRIFGDCLAAAWIAIARDPMRFCKSILRRLFYAKGEC